MKIGSKAKEEELQGKAKITKNLVKILINSNYYWLLSLLSLNSIKLFAY